MDRHASNHYPTSSAEVIRSRDVPSISASDCALFLWTTNQHLKIALCRHGSLGLRIQVELLLGKRSHQYGPLEQEQARILLIGTRGEFRVPAPGRATGVANHGATWPTFGQA